MFELLDRMPRQPPAGTEKPLGAPEGGEVVFNNVWCALPRLPAAALCHACIGVTRTTGSTVLYCARQEASGGHGVR